MSINSLQKQTNINIQEKANLIWEIATHLVGLFKPHEYGKVILPIPQSSTDIFAEIKALEEEETALMKELFGNG